MCATKERSPRDYEWVRVHVLMAAWADARAKGSVSVEQRNELFEALYFAVDRLARKVVGRRGPARSATPIAGELAGKVWKKGFTDLLVKFDPQKGDAFSWFYRILLNSWSEWLAHEKTQGDPIGGTDEEWEVLWAEVADRLRDMPVGHPFGAMPLEPDEALERKQADPLFLAMHSLTERQQKVLRLRVDFGYTAEQCANELGIDKSTVDREMAKVRQIAQKSIAQT